MKLDLEHEYFRDLTGVFVVWFGQEPHEATVVRVGQGHIAERLAELRKASEVYAHASRGLRVTWASVGDDCVDGVEAYLVRELSPLIQEDAPPSSPIDVNLPWSLPCPT